MAPERCCETMNVLDALGIEGAEELGTKVELAMKINSIIEKRHLNQAAAAALLGIQQPKVSALKNYKLDGFSVERLMELLVALGRDVEIRVKRSPKNRPARVCVVSG